MSTKRFGDIRVSTADQNTARQEAKMKALETFTIQRSLSMKGCPYDNAVAEATFKVFKTEFANQLHFLLWNILKLNSPILFIGLIIFVFMEH